ncbi:hypothetical protein AMATHDRAFT_3555 [Amanita thiersii Skay4041]|uniref:Uncharacterized protein n=1 Tax=Amanita thiersii Skay4041 TaxID=703135 RepID=A0A2A9NRN7_9AGAR|nr:hypothetical protein AMATHDRAFT_3555 [Amanita thiersii Skay4041]
MSQIQSRVASSATNSASKNKSTTSSCSSSKKLPLASMASNKFVPLAVLKDTVRVANPIKQSPTPYPKNRAVLPVIIPVPQITTPPEHPPHYIPAFNYSQESLENQGEPADIPNSWKFPGQLPGTQPVVILESWKHAGGKFIDNQSDNSDRVVPILQVTGPNSPTYAATAAQGVPMSSKQVFRNPHKDHMAKEAKKWEIIEANWDTWNDASSNFLKNKVEGRNATFTAVYKIAKQPRLDWGDGPDTDHKIGYINSWLEDQKKFNQLPPEVIYFEGVDEKRNEYRCIHKTYRDYFIWQKRQDEKDAMEVQNDNSLPSIPAPKPKGKQKALLPSPSSSSSLYVSSGELEKTLNELFDEMVIECSKTEKSNWKGKLANAGPSN